MSLFLFLHRTILSLLASAVRWHPPTHGKLLPQFLRKRTTVADDTNVLHRFFLLELTTGNGKHTISLSLSLTISLSLTHNLSLYLSRNFLKNALEALSTYLWKPWKPSAHISRSPGSPLYISLEAPYTYLCFFLFLSLSLSLSQHLFIHLFISLSLSSFAASLTPSFSLSLFLSFHLSFSQALYLFTLSLLLSFLSHSLCLFSFTPSNFSSLILPGSLSYDPYSPSVISLSLCDICLFTLTFLLSFFFSSLCLFLSHSLRLSVILLLIFCHFSLFVFFSFTLSVFPLSFSQVLCYFSVNVLSSFLSYSLCLFLSHSLFLSLPLTLSVFLSQSLYLFYLISSFSFFPTLCTPLFLYLFISLFPSSVSLFYCFHKNVSLSSIIVSLCSLLCPFFFFFNHFPQNFLSMPLHFFLSYFFLFLSFLVLIFSLSFSLSLFPLLSFASTISLILILSLFPFSFYLFFVKTNCLH
ncbi:unnamed protein product [Acanthosepion pharaonis]|uniref:Uncharacterized protein n=1 Tax=Acanthosepion pharaonis TaxID=158019 RepID=A0A812CY32_ACAPH|nr:unnamed protein product [Sepia pharaonis]